MLGMMMDRPLLIGSFLQYAADYHGDVEIVSTTHDHPRHRTNYTKSLKRTKQLANALRDLGVGFGDRVATLAWNDFRHFELYFGVPSMGAVCHTINPRLHTDQVTYIVNHAADKVICFDPVFLPILEAVADKCPTLTHYVCLASEKDLPTSEKIKILSYETILDGASQDFDFPDFDERSASAMCYTSGTTGNPKGVLFAHRAQVLHSMAVALPAGLNLSPLDAVLPVVPMFHANAWGIPYSAAMVGAKQVFPGPKLDGKSLTTVFNEEKVTLSAGVPTVWLGLLNHLKETGEKLETVKMVTIGGSAAARSMIDAFEDDHGIKVMHAWGMTEMSPVGTFGGVTQAVATKSAPQRRSIQELQGHGIWGVDMKIADEDGHELPRDGESVGELFVRGPWIASGYYDNPEATKGAFDDTGWFGTGDVAAITPEGYLKITDRSKDVIKSGGEWISSIDVENIALGHDKVAEAAVIAIPNDKWDERPLLVIVPTSKDDPMTAEEMQNHFDGKIAKWWMPDAVVNIEAMPHTATGKIQKRTLRERFPSAPTSLTD